MRALAIVVLGLVGCRTTPEGPSGQGGAGFNDAPTRVPTLPMQALFPVCWPNDAGRDARVTLNFRDRDVTFQATPATLNGVGWCLREIATSYPPSQRPRGELEVAPPSAPVDLWAALAWVHLLAPDRFGPERGLLDPAPLAAACLARSSNQPGRTLSLLQTPTLGVLGVSPVDVDRCLEAVLLSTAWPAPKALVLQVSPAKAAPAGDVSFYFAPDTDPAAPLDPQRVRETLREASPAVGACWNEALVRRAGLGGARTFRFRTDDEGQVTAAWVATSLGDGPEASDWVLDRCLSQVLKRQRFAGTRGDGVYTWVFATR